MENEKWEKQKKTMENEDSEFENLSKIFKKELTGNFEENPEEIFQGYFQEIKTELNEIYDNVYEKDAGLAEGYTLEQHTSMVINQFSKYYDQFKEKLPYFITKETFLQMLTIHDIGKVSESVQSLKKEGVEKSVWKKEEELQTGIIAREILEKTEKLDSKHIDIILEVIGQGSKKMDELITGKISSLEMKEYLVEKAEELSISKPEDFFNILETYLMCDAGAYTVQAVEDFRNEIGDEKTDDILREYKKGEKDQFAGLGVTKWFREEGGKNKFVNNNRFGEHMAEDWIDDVRKMLNIKNILSNPDSKTKELHDFRNYIELINSAHKIIESFGEYELVEDDIDWKESFNQIVNIRKKIFNIMNGILDEEKYDFKDSNDIFRILKLTELENQFNSFGEKEKLVNKWIDSNLDNNNQQILESLKKTNNI